MDAKKFVDSVVNKSFAKDARDLARKSAVALNHTISKLSRAAEILGGDDPELYEQAYKLIADEMCSTMIDAERDASLAGTYAKIARGAA